MTCPHCQRRLLRKERTDRVCAHCTRPFAFDPRLDGLHMNDLRIERRAGRVTRGGRLHITLTHLWYLTRTSNPAWGPIASSGVPDRIRRRLAVPAGAALIVLAVVVRHGLVTFAVCLACFALFLWAAGGRYLPAQQAGATNRPGETDFMAVMRGRWVDVYGELPAGVVDEDGDEAGAPMTRPAARVPRPRAALLCPNRPINVFLAANRFPGRLDLALASTADGLPADVPVVVLHDAGAYGVLLVAAVREAQSGRVVVDAGLPVRPVKDNPGAVRLRTNLLSGISPHRLRTEGGLPPAEADLLYEGWWSPLAAVPPARLAAIVVRAVDRAVRHGRGTAAGDPDRRDRSVGFPTWPEPPGAVQSRAEMAP